MSMQKEFEIKLIDDEIERMERELAGINFILNILNRCSVFIFCSFLLSLIILIARSIL